MICVDRTASAAHTQRVGESHAPRVDTVCTRGKAAFQQIIWLPDLDLSWLMPRVKLLQVLLALAAALSPTHHVSMLHRVDMRKTPHIRRAAVLIKAVIMAAESIHPVSDCYNMAAFYFVDWLITHTTNIKVSSVEGSLLILQSCNSQE